MKELIEIARRVMLIARESPNSSDARRFALSCLEPVGACAFPKLASVVLGDDGAGWTSHRWRKQAMSDWLFLSQGEALPTVHNSRRRVSVEKVDAVVQFVLCQVEFVNCTDARRIVYGGKEFLLPVFRAKMSIEEMWRQYGGEEIGSRKRKKLGTVGENSATADIMSFSSFFRIARVLTRGRSHQHSGGSTVLYTLGRLTMHYIWNLLQLLKDDMQKDDFDVLVSQFENVEAFLLVDFKKHVSTRILTQKGDDPGFCFGQAADFDASAEPQFGAVKGRCCQMCTDSLLFPFAITSAVKRALPQTPLRQKKLERLKNGMAQSCAIRIRSLMAYLIRVVRQRLHITEQMLLMDRSQVFVFADFKEKWLAERHSESQAFHYGKAGISIHGAAIIRLKIGVPEAVLENARKNLNDVNKWVRQIFDVMYYIQIVDQPHAQDGALTMALLEDLLLYVKDNPKLEGIKSVKLCTDNARNYCCSLVVRALPLLQLSTGITVDLYLHNEPGDGKTLLDAFFGLVSMALSRWLDRKGNNVVTPSQAANAVANSLPSATVALVTLNSGTSSAQYLCDEVCSNRNLRATILGISTKRRIEYGERHAKLFNYGSYESAAVKATKILIESRGFTETKRRFVEYEQTNCSERTIFGVSSDVLRESRLSLQPFREISAQSSGGQDGSGEQESEIAYCGLCGMRFVARHACQGAKILKDVTGVALQLAEETVRKGWTFDDGIAQRNRISCSAPGYMMELYEMAEKLRWMLSDNTGQFIPGHAACTGNIPTTNKFVSFFIRWATEYKTRNLSAPRPHIAAEYIENVTEDGLPALNLTDIPAHSTIASICTRFHKGELVLTEGERSEENDVDDDESVDAVLTNMFEVLP